jgi:hypothetical protein
LKSKLLKTSVFAQPPDHSGEESRKYTNAIDAGQGISLGEPGQAVARNLLNSVPAPNTRENLKNRRASRANPISVKEPEVGKHLEFAAQNVALSCRYATICH